MTGLSDGRDELTKAKVTPVMRKNLPEWVLAEYCDYLLDLYSQEGDVPDDANLSPDERVQFYELILCNPDVAGIWKTLETHRHLWDEHLWEGLGEDDELPDTQLVRHVLISVHMNYRRFTPLESMRRTARDDLGNEIESLAKKLQAKLAYLWSLSGPEEREYPAQFAGLVHETTQKLLGDIAVSSSRWVETQPVLLRPGRGDAQRRFFIIEMAGYFEAMFRALDESGQAVEAHRFVNVVTALANALFPDDGGIDQPGVASLLDIVKRAKTAP